MSLVDVTELIGKRNIARQNKNYELADSLRIQLEALGVELHDTPTGTTWHYNIAQKPKTEGGENLMLRSTKEHCDKQEPQAAIFKKPYKGKIKKGKGV